MKYFDRVYSLDISPDIRVTDLRINFEVRKDIGTNKNSSKIIVYNLSENTRNRISSEKLPLVILKAGYLNNVGLVNIGKGNITDIIHEYKAPEVVTTIYCKDGLTAIKNKYVTLSFNEKTPLSSIIKTIVNKMGIGIRYTNYKESALLKTGYSYVGSVSSALDDLSRQFDFSWSIQNGELQILSKNTSTRIQSVHLSSSTGLIESPSRVVKMAEDNVVRHQLSCLLQPQLEVGDLISVESKTLNGVFKVEELIHSGDTHNNIWTTKLIITNG